MRSVFNNKAVSLIEYVVLFLIIASAFIVMQHILQHRIYGNWAKTGQSFAYGRQYDSQKTLECAYDDVVNEWYDRHCYQNYINTQQCNNVLTCDENGVISCSLDSCNQLNNGAMP